MTSPVHPPYRYRPAVLAALEVYGVRPTERSDPFRVYELVKSLYAWEIRNLKADFRRIDPEFGKATRASYGEANRRLLERYAVLRVPPHEWVER
jgi:hypothetical protein